MTIRISLLIALALTTMSGPASAWRYEGHEVIGSITD